MEVRIKLSEIQIRTLVDAQMKFDQVSKVFQETKENLERIRALIYDVNGIPIETNASLSLPTQELIYEKPDKKPVKKTTKKSNKRKK